MKNAYHLLTLFAFIYLAGCQKNGEIIIMGNGLVIEDLVIGEGSEAPVSYTHLRAHET